MSKDYEQLPEVSEAMVYAAMVRLMLRRLAEAAQGSLMVDLPHRLGELYPLPACRASTRARFAISFS